MERLLLLLYLHKLLLHWIGVEYGRVQLLRQGLEDGGAFGRTDTGGGGLERGSAAVVGDVNKAPLSALAGLMTQWRALAELGLVKAFVGNEGDVRKWTGEGRGDDEDEPDLEGRRVDRSIFLSEVLTMFLVVRKMLFAPGVRLVKRYITKC